MLQMIVQPTPTPQPIVWNYEELKADLNTSLKEIETRVYTEEDIAEAKKQKAALIALKTTIDEERKRREREYNAPFATFKSQVKELCELIDAASKSISVQLDAFEEKRIEEKRMYIENEYATCVLTIMGYANIPEWLTLDRIFDDRWLNKTFTMPKVKGAIEEILEGVSSDLETLRGMNDLVGIECYKKTLNLNEAIKASREHAAMQAKAQEAKIEIAAKDTVPNKVSNSLPAEEEATWVSFRALLTKEQARGLAGYCRLSNIKIEPIKEV